MEGGDRVSGAKGEKVKAPQVSNTEALLAAEVRRLRAVLSRTCERVEYLAHDVQGIAHRLAHHEGESIGVDKATRAVAELRAMVTDLADQRG